METAHKETHDKEIPVPPQENLCRRCIGGGTDIIRHHTLQVVREPL